MFRLGKINKLDEMFSLLSVRKSNTIYFYRISRCSDEILHFLKKYYEEARRTGVIIDGRIQNPTPQNLEYFFEMMGQHFSFDKAFLNASLQKWLPRMSNEQRESVVDAMYSTFQDMKRSGKNDNMLKMPTPNTCVGFTTSLSESSINLELILRRKYCMMAQLVTTNYNF